MAPEAPSLRRYFATYIQRATSNTDGDKQVHTQTLPTHSRRSAQSVQLAGRTTKANICGRSWHHGRDKERVPQSGDRLAVKHNPTVALSFMLPSRLAHCHITF